MKKNVLKIEANMMPLPGRESYSILVFGHTADSLLDIGRSYYPLCGGYAGDFGSVSFYRCDDLTFCGLLHRHYSTISECMVDDSDNARQWLAEAVLACTDRDAPIPASILDIPTDAAERGHRVER